MVVIFHYKRMSDSRSNLNKSTQRKESNLVCGCCYNRSPTSLTTGSNSPDNAERAGLSPLSRRSSRWGRRKCKQTFLSIYC
uniref:Uncharacterized protein n=1 Tax=Glossina pallidipes TaxID=7398 RepID=A0A1A9Z202_GLOPL